MGDKVTTAPAEKISPPAPEMAPAAPAAGFDAAAMDAKRTAAAEARKQEAADNAGKDPEKELDAGMASAAGTAAEVPEQAPATSVGNEVVPDAKAKLFSKARWSAVALDVARGLALDSKSADQGFFEGLFSSLKLTGLKIMTWFTGKSWYNSLSEEDKQLLETNYGIKATGDEKIFEWAETTEAASAETPPAEAEKKELTEEEKNALPAQLEKAKLDELTGLNLLGSVKKIEGENSSPDHRVTLRLPYLEDDEIKYVEDVRITSNIIKIGDRQYYIDKPFGPKEDAADEVVGFKLTDLSFALQDDGKVEGAATVNANGKETKLSGLLAMLEDMRANPSNKKELTLENGEKMGFHLNKATEQKAESASGDAVAAAFKTEMDKNKDKTVDLTTDGSKFDFQLPFLKDGKVENTTATMTSSTFKVGDKNFKIKLPNGVTLQQLEFKDSAVTMTAGSGLASQSGDLPFERMAALFEELRSKDENVDFDLNGNKITFELQKENV